MRARLRRVSLCLLVAGAALVPTQVLADSPELVADGGFETPVVPAATYQLYRVGQMVGPWRVVGAPGDVAVIDAAFAQFGDSFPPASGRQALDLTGRSNTATGVEQTVATVPGGRYELRFWVGTLYVPSRIYGVASTALVLVDGRRIYTATNSTRNGGPVQVWRAFTTTFTATRSSTVLEFINGDPATDNENGLDDVSLRQVGGDLASFATLPTPAEAFGSVAHDAAVVAVAAGVTLFITFPAALFNHTLEENYAGIVGWIRRRLPWRGGARAAPGPPTIGRRDVLRVGAVIGLGAICGGLLDPTFAITWKGLQTFVSVVLTVLFFMALAGAVGFGYRRLRTLPRSLKLVALPAGLVVAALCVLVSRVTNFQPGYLYGVIAGVGFVESMSAREDAHVAQLAALATLVAAGTAWFGWSIVNPSAAGAGALFPLIILDNVLAAIFVGGVTGSVIGLLPLRFLPGGRIVSWRRAAWAVTFGLALIALLGVLLWPNHRAPGPTPLVTAVGLLLGFAAISVGFWWICEQHRHRAAAAG